MPSNSTYACLNCQIAWKAGTGCLRCGQPAAYMGKRWHAPKSTNDSAWRKMRKAKEAGVEWREWALWDKPRQIKPREIYRLTPEDHKQRVASIKAMRENVKNRWYEEMERLMAESREKKAAVKAKIKEHRRAKRLAERSET